MNRPGGSGSRDGESAELLRLRAENGTLRRRLEQRESSLADLNRRLLTLERGQSVRDRRDAASSAARMDALRSRITVLEAEIGFAQAQMEATRAEAASLAQELDRLHATRLFRYATPFRRFYGVLRRLGRGLR